MTSSFGITPQRQIRDLVAAPEAPTRPAEPARPAQEPQQLGGQLMYGRQFQPDTKTEQTLKSIETFLGENGLYQTGQKMLFEQYKKDKQQQARQLLEQEATALYDTEENAKDIKALQAKGDVELAKQTRLSNPWVNFFYYDTKATNAGQQAAVELAGWAKTQASAIAEIDDPAERAAALTRKSQQILAQYADIPEAFKAAKIDPLIAATQADIKADIANKVFERRDLTIKQTGDEILLGKWKLGAKFNTIEQNTQFSADMLKAGVLEQRDWLINKNGYSKQQATDALFNLFDKDSVFLDANGDGLNDIGSTYSAYNILSALGDIDVDGLKLLNLRDSKGRNLRAVIEGAVDRATKREELREGSIERGIQRNQREFTRTIKDRSTLWWTENPNATDAQIIQRIREEEAFALEQSRRGYLPAGMSYQGAVDLIRDQYKFSDRKLLTPEQGAALLEQAKDLIDAGVTEMPADLRAQLQGTNLYVDALKLFGNARRSANAADRAAGIRVQKTLLKGLMDGLKGSFMQDPQIKAMDKEKGEVPKQKRAFLNQAIIEAKQRLNAEAGPFLTREINRARAAGKDINDPAVQLEILKKAQTDFYARPEYNDVDRYYNVTEYGKLGAKAAAPALGSSRKDSNGRWVIDIKDTDNRAAWSASASSTYGRNPNLARTALNSQMFFNDVEIGEINKAVITGDLNSLSQAVRQSLNNLSRTAFQGKVPVSEIIERQLKTYYGNEFLPPNLKQRTKQIEASVRPVDTATGTQPSDVGIRVTNWHHGHSQNRAIDFTLVRQNGQIANNVPAPISGRVIFAGRDGGFGNSVIIEAATAGPGYNKGDRVRVAHLAQLYWKTGDQISRGRPVGKSGDDSPHDSVPGRSGTGAGDPGHVHIQVYKPGAGVPTQAFQYSQDHQAKFVQQNLVPLFKR
jgi:hypothetical protein